MRSLGGKLDGSELTFNFPILKRSTFSAVISLAKYYFAIRLLIMELEIACQKLPNELRFTLVVVGLYADIHFLFAETFKRIRRNFFDCQHAAPPRFILYIYVVLVIIISTTRVRCLLLSYRKAFLYLKYFSCFFFIQ